MKKDVFKRIIADFREKDLSYVMERDLSIPLDTGKIISLIGVRRSGKTHVLFSLIKQIKKTAAPENILYINFEDDRLFPIELKYLSNMLLIN